MERELTRVLIYKAMGYGGCRLILVMQHTHTHTNTQSAIYHSQNKSTKDPRGSAPFTGMWRKGKIFFFDKKLFSYRRPGGVRGILLCLAFVLLYENM